MATLDTLPSQKALLLRRSEVMGLVDAGAGDPSFKRGGLVSFPKFTALPPPRGEPRESDLSTSPPPGAEQLLACREKQTLGEPRGDRQSPSLPRGQPAVQRETEIKLAILISTTPGRSLG